MKSPFPGMDPYIEARGLWEDFHQELVSEIKQSLAQQVPEGYVARFGERSYIVMEKDDDDGTGVVTERNRTQADVAVTLAASERPASEGGVAVAEPPAIVTETPIEMRGLTESESRETFVEIYQLNPQRRLVTTIEVLSPSNKRENTIGWMQITRKRQAHLEGAANLVEIDLLRSGTRMPMETDWPPGPYYLLVCRKRRAPSCDVWPACFKRPLPTVPVPLQPPDADLSLDLQPMVDRIYARSRYETDIDYRKPCSPPLAEADTAWLGNQLETES